MKLDWLKESPTRKTCNDVAFVKLKFRQLLLRDFVGKISPAASTLPNAKSDVEKSDVAKRDPGSEEYEERKSS